MTDNVTKNRHIYVGGSDVPVILGQSKFSGQYDLARQKAGIEKRKFEGNEYTAFGNAMEPQIRQYINLTNEDDYNFVENTVKDEVLGLRSNTDGVDKENKVLLEIKTHGKTPTFDVYKSQMQLYMYQNDLDKGILALYKRNDDFDIEFDSENLTTMIVQRDDDFIKMLLKEIKLFWERVTWLKSNPGASEHDFNNCLKEKLKGGQKNVSNQLAVKTIKLVDPVIEFNYEELEANLNESLKKYEGLTFTETTLPEGKKIRTELNAGIKAVEAYRIQTKKKLNEPIVAFEDKMKKLVSKFNEVRDPIDKQIKEFEANEKELKRKEVEEYITSAINEHEEIKEEAIREAFEFNSKWLNKSATIKSIKEDVDAQVLSIVTDIQLKEQQQELIATHVELVNAKSETNLIADQYFRLLDSLNVDEIKEQIDKDAETYAANKQKQLIEEAKRLAKKEEQEKKLKEYETKEEVAEPVEEELLLDVYEITATEKQFEELETFMKQKGIKFSYK